MEKTLRKLLFIGLLLCGLGVAQAPTFTYNIPVGDTCTSTINGCTLHNLTTTDPTAPTEWGYFIGGTYWTQFDFQLYQGQNAAAGATSCVGNGIYNKIPRPDISTNATEWTLNCTSNMWTNGSGAGELGVVGPYNIVVDLIATVSQRLIKSCSRSGCTWSYLTIWTINNGTVLLTPVG